jgi:hypothetical protein
MQCSARPPKAMSIRDLTRRLYQAMAFESFQISLHDLSIDEAETSIARLWVILVAYAIPTPRLRAHFGSDGRITIDLFCESAAETALLCGVLRDGRGGQFNQRSAART